MKKSVNKKLIGAIIAIVVVIAAVRFKPLSKTLTYVKTHILYE